MIDFLNLGVNNYKFWLTYENEYLNDALLLETSIRLKTWGRFRPGYAPNLNASQIVDRLYGGSPPHAIMIDSCLIRSGKAEDERLFEGLKDLSKKSILIFTIGDPWRFMPAFKNFSETIAPHFWLVNSKFYADIFNQYLKGTKSRAYMMPYCIGRRYFNMGLEREYDLGLIGRCWLNKKSLKPWRLRWKLKILYEGTLLDARRGLEGIEFAQRHSDLIVKLNRCLSSWNSPATPKGTDILHTPRRYIESAACGAISITPVDFSELNEYYLPRNAYLNCESNLNKAVELVKMLRGNTERFLELQQRAYRLVMGNHQAQNRVRFILDLINGKRDADARDYYLVS